ncbi:GAF domain-containing protein [Klenkia terrae]|nr:GAF domain-containing protein [Klenkia terrae]
MPVLGAFGAALAASAEQWPEVALLPQRLAGACAQVLPVTGAGMSLYFAPGRRLPLGASDEMAGTAERLQFTVGEGPCLAAHAEQRPVVADEAELAARWPAFTAELVAQTPIRGVIALPLSDGLASVGVLDLYLAAPNQVGDLSLVDALVVSGEVTRVFQLGASSEHISPTRGGPSGPAWLEAPPARQRARVWQAMGMVNAGLNIDSVDALAVLRSHAYSHDTDVDTIADLVVDGFLPVQELAPDLGAP